MNFLSSIGQSLIQSATGMTQDQLQAQLTAAETQLQIGLSVCVGLQAIIAAELFVLVVIAIKYKR